MDNNQELHRNRLIITSLKQRFAEKLANLEEEIANMRADATMLSDAYVERVKSLEEEVNTLTARLEGNSEDVSQEDEAATE